MLQLRSVGQLKSTWPFRPLGGSHAAASQLCHKEGARSRQRDAQQTLMRESEQLVQRPEQLVLEAGPPLAGSLFIADLQK